MCKLPSKYQQKDSARHSLESETPFSVYLGLLIYAKCDLPAEEPRGESICVGGAAMVNSKPPHKRLKLMRIMSFCHIKSQASKCSMVNIIIE
jgi:hypothetical protein